MNCHRSSHITSFFLDPKSPPQLSFDHLLLLCRDVTNGFSYLTNVGFVHRDLGARNVLLNEEFVAKIGDFGMARNLYNTKYQRQSVVDQWALPVRLVGL